MPSECVDGSLRYTRGMYGSSDVETHEEYIAGVEESRRADIKRLHDLIREVAPELEPTMEFKMLGYGKYSYKYASGLIRDTAAGNWGS